MRKFLTCRGLLTSAIGRIGSAPVIRSDDTCRAAVCRGMLTDWAKRDPHDSHEGKFLTEPDHWARLNKRCVEMSELAVSGLFAVATCLLGLSASMFDHWYFYVAVGLGALLLVLAVVVTIVRSRYRKQETAQLQVVLDKGLGPLVQSLAHLCTVSSRPERRTRAAQIRVAVAAAAASLVGTSAEGTRANLFRLRETPEGRVMELDTNCWAGRGDKSRRRFTDEHETMKKTLANETRFVAKVADESLNYETYFTHPIAGSDEKIFGVLTVDSLRSGELDEETDLPAMRLLAALAACTYACEA